MVEITYDQDMLRQVERKLGRVKSEAPKALKNALNQTARQARTDLKNQVRKQYMVKAGKVSQAMRVQKATNSKLDATIFVKGKVLNITNYKTSTPKKGAKAQVKKDGGLKQIIGPKGITAFKGINDLLWQRRGKERYPIKPLKSLSIPKAIGNEKKVYGVVRPDIKKNLKANVDAQVRKILGRWSMTAAFLQSELADELKKILSDFRLKNPQGEPSGINIFEQLLPMSEPLGQGEIASELLENGLVDVQTAPAPYPYIIVRLDEGEIEDADSAQKVNLSLLIGIYDPDYEKQGHKDILNIIAKIYERFAKCPVLNGKYTIQYPILWVLQEEESYPFYFGGMTLGFETAMIRREDPYS